MNRDIRATDNFKRVTQRFVARCRPGSGEPIDLQDLAMSKDGKFLAGGAEVVESLEGPAQFRIGLVEVASGTIKLISPGPGVERSPRWSPDGQSLAYLSDRDRPSAAHVRLLDLKTQQECSIEIEKNLAEQLRWSPDGKSILILAAGLGADVAGAQGAVPIKLATKDAPPAWAPEIDIGVTEKAWRSLWVYSIDTGAVRKVSPAGLNIWEAAWCGSRKIAVIASESPGEQAWYTANVRTLDIDTGKVQVLRSPTDQVGWLSASDSGARMAIVEAICSDRTLVAGELALLDPEKGTVSPVNTHGVDVTYTAWQGEDALLYAGHRSFETVMALYKPSTGATQVLWASQECTFGDNRYPKFAHGSQPGDCAFLAEGFFKAPHVVVISQGKARAIKSFGSDALIQDVAALGKSEPYRWSAPDGLEIHGWLTVPATPGPHPLVLNIHGGPVWIVRPIFLGRNVLVRTLLEAGYAVFQPNVRGSAGRGQPYARAVFGDIGGAETQDHLAGLDALVKSGIADPARIGVTGGSHGGFMTSWLVTQNRRFAAAVSVCPVTNWASEYLVSNIPYFCELALADKITNFSGKYYTRSPIYYASEVSTPTLNICGMLDRCTPPNQAVEFHNALLLQGVESALVKYPLEGHGARSQPAVSDYIARVVSWFEEHMPAGPKPSLT